MQYRIVPRAEWLAVPLISKLMGLFFSIDAMIGREFEAGLGDLKTLAEK